MTDKSSPSPSSAQRSEVMSAPKPLSPEELEKLAQRVEFAYAEQSLNAVAAAAWGVPRLLATIEADRKEIAKLKIDLALEKELVCRGSDEVVNRNQEIAKLKGARDRALALCDFYDLPGTRSELAAGLTDFKVDELVMVEFIDKLRAACE